MDDEIHEQYTQDINICCNVMTKLHETKLLARLRKVQINFIESLIIYSSYIIKIQFRNN